MTRPVSLIAAHNFCSLAHFSEWKRAQRGPAAGGWRGGSVSKTCAECDTPYLVAPSIAATSRFCSRRCKGIHARTLTAIRQADGAISIPGIRVVRRIVEVAP